MKVLHLLGPRPNYVKCAPLYNALLGRASQVLVSTGQHYDFNLTGVFLRDFEVTPPTYNLGVGSGSHCQQVSRTIRGLEPILTEVEPDVVIVYGDTNSTLGGALASSMLRMPVVHVEAGSRVGGLNRPEDLNRVIVDRISAVNCCATERCASNLNAEGLSMTALLSGDVLLDLYRQLLPRVISASQILEVHSLVEDKYILATIHRAENTDDDVKLRNIFVALIECESRVVIPLHPRTRKALARIGMLDEVSTRLQVLPPLGYLAFSRLLIGASRVITDSGGVQKEAYFSRCPCITVNSESHWPETVEAGWNIVAGSEVESIRRALEALEVPDLHPEVFGEGDACEIIVEYLLDVFDSGR